MSFKRHLPNVLTLGNLFCGTLAAIFAVERDFNTVAVLVLIGIVFDFFDGFVARILGVSGELGKQLDSLADVVTSGVVPGIVMFQLLSEHDQSQRMFGIFPYLGLLLTLGACYRLAKFNLDTRQSDAFIGLPTPAMSLFVISLPIIASHSPIVVVQDLFSNTYVLVSISLLLTYLMNAEITLFSLKFKDFSMKNNRLTYLFLSSSLLLIILLQFLAVPIIIIVYVLLSIIINYATKTAI